MKKGSLIEGVTIVDIGAKGKVIGKKDGVAFLTQDAVPGDVVSLRLKRNKKGMKFGMVETIESPSSDRTDPVCVHFNHCGGCNWQNLSYAKQLELKEERVAQQLKRIGGFESYDAKSILGSERQFQYRNKLEFTFVANRWLTPEEIQETETIEKGPALGFHVPGRFDWVVHINECHLQNELHNEIRNAVFDKAQELGISFYHPREQQGTLRNIVLRNNRDGEWMLILIVKNETSQVNHLLEQITEQFHQIKSCWLIHNQKLNDNYSDCPMSLFKGSPSISETFERPDEHGPVVYSIGPKSFFQTNPDQAERLYQLVYEWADIQNGECVYDLYTGTGSIALYVADRAKKVIGIEYVPEAIDDAKENALLNRIENTSFFAGDMKDLLTNEFINEHGHPDVLIADPPRAGMHPDVVERILETMPNRIVYVSCDPATQARDMSMLKEKYDLVQSQAVDMFPHTSHVENVALLRLRDELIV